jgi:hypothetical protein
MILQHRFMAQTGAKWVAVQCPLKVTLSTGSWHKPVLKVLSNGS